jgi:subtilisin family serine protease
MMGKQIRGLVVVAVAATTFAALAPAVQGTTVGPGETLLVRFRPSTSLSEAEASLRAGGVTKRRDIPGTGFTEITTGGRPADQVRRQLIASGAEVEPNLVRRAAVVPNDPGYSSRQVSYMEAINLPAAWDLTIGRDDLVVAVVDSGVDLDHPDLAGRLVQGIDIVNGDNLPDDDLGHGTMVAGIVAARTSNGTGVAGVTWRGGLMPVKVLDANGVGNDADIAAGIVWAADHGAAVINLSLGGPGSSRILQTAIDHAVARNVVVVAAAGNEGTSEPNWPAAAVGAVAVGATDGSNNRASFSNFGPWLDLMAPGTRIFSTATGVDFPYALGSGTSYSTPIVAGAALLARSADRTATPEQLAERLRRGARDLGAPGFDSTFGAGLVDVLATLRLGSPSLSQAGANGSIPGVDAGYWMLGTDGMVYPFGNAPGAGDPAAYVAADGIPAADIEPTPSGNGYWVLDERGSVFSFGDAGYRGGLPDGYLAPGEKATSLSATATGRGYWIFTTRGRAANFGDALFLGDMRAVALNGPVLDSVATPTGQGYYMVASDGGIFTFGDARFHDSMGGKKLNAPVRSLVPDPDGVGYWLVASDGGVFAFDADFRGSMGATKLNAPVTGMVANGNGYLMVATDGGIFNFSDKPFAGSMGSNPPARPIISVAIRP